MATVLIAHQGGWDEALLVLIPIGFIFLMLYLAKRKADRTPSATAETHSDPAPDRDAAEYPG